MTRKNFTIILIMLIQIASMITFNLLDSDYLYNMAVLGFLASLIILGILNVLSSDIMYWFSEPIFRKNKKLE